MSLPLRLALRDLRGGLAGLRLLAICLFLGVAALAGIGSLSSAIVTGLSERGQEYLGGDLQVDIAQRPAEEAELAAFRALGSVSHVTRMRAMAARPDGSASLLVELKGVENAWPLYGAFGVTPGSLKGRPQGAEAAIGPELAERLNLKIGDRLRVGSAMLRVVAIIAEEPDRAGMGFTLGPPVIVDRAGLEATGLVQPGSLYRSLYRIRMPAGASVEAATEMLEARFPDAGFDIDDRTNSAPGTRRFIERLAQFLTLVGLTALAVAGIGVGNGVTSYLESKRGSIATLKLLGATSPVIARMFAIEIGIVTAGAILLGLAAGALVPWAVALLAGSSLPVPPSLGIYPAPLAIAAAYGLLIAALFAVLPLARAGRVTAGSLFRGSLDSAGRLPPRAIGLVAVTAAAIAGLAIATAREPLFALGFLGAALGVLAILALLGWLVVRAAAALPRPKSPLLRLALANLHRPGAQTGRLVVALGLGFTLFATLATIETNLGGQIRSTIPDRAPSFFMLDIPSTEVPRFRALADRAAPGGELELVPSLRGSVVAIKGARVSQMESPPEGAWFLRGDRGLTYAARLPEGNRVVEGQWWAADYRGPPLVSLDAENARAAGLKVGDAITVSILGREIEARIASLREVDWDSMGFNFAVIFAPGAIEAAPHSFMATISMPEHHERGFSHAVSNAFPSVSVIRVKEVVGTIAGMMEQLAVAIRAAASVAILAGIAVLIGALAASRRARVYDSVILKLLGATRGRILAVQALEFVALAAIVALIALGLGAAAGWYVMTQVFELNWGPDWTIVGLTLLGGAAVTLVIGLAGALPALTARPAQALRDL